MNWLILKHPAVRRDLPTLSQPAYLYYHPWESFKMNYYKTHRFKTLFEPGCLQHFTARSRGTPGKVKRSGCPKSSLDSLDSSSLQQFTAVYSSLQQITVFSQSQKSAKNIVFYTGRIKKLSCQKRKKSPAVFSIWEMPFSAKNNRYHSSFMYKI